MTKRLGIAFISLGLLLLAIEFVYIVPDTNRPIAHQIFFGLSSMVSLCLGISLIQFEKSKEKRIKATWILLSIGALLILFGLLLGQLRMPSARIQVILGVVLICFGVGPLIVKARFEKWREFTKSNAHALGLSLADLLSFILLSLGALFKFQHWPGAKNMMILGALMLVVAGYAWNRVFKKIVFKQKVTEQELQNAFEQLVEKSQEITDSITYAKRIQEAILPPARLVSQYLKNSFILYKPKDIVAGDFYWMHCVPAGRETAGDLVIFAAADCTGHGVPGAMVSVVCSNALNRAVREFGLTKPAQILDKTLEIVIERFEKSEEEVKDGMDIALCALNTKTNELQYAGANNPLWIISPNAEMKSSPASTQLSTGLERGAPAGRGVFLHEIKATKQPIGKYSDPKPYENHSIQLKAGDTAYLFSDGFPDQFGGDRGKKLKTRAFKELLLSIQDQTMDTQKKSIDDYFESWRGENEQIDDVCVIGVRV